MENIYKKICSVCNGKKEWYCKTAKCMYPCQDCNGTGYMILKVIKGGLEMNNNQNKFNTYRVDYFLLSLEWKERGIEAGRISYVVRGGDNEEKHKKFCKDFKDKLLREHDEQYTSWVFTDSKFKNIGKIDPFVSVLHFRIRDVW